MATPYSKFHESPTRFGVDINGPARSFTCEAQAANDYWVPSLPGDTLYLLKAKMTDGDDVNVELFGSLAEAEALADQIDLQAQLSVSVRPSSLSECDVDRALKRMSLILTETTLKQAEKVLVSYNQLVDRLEVVRSEEESEAARVAIRKYYTACMAHLYSYYGQVVEVPNRLNLPGLVKVEIIVLHREGSNKCPRPRRSHDI